ncbi:uncharacterized protein N7459_004486 [Penicillium hispanicum]|uniref:uncharacterized protein n=1 Tax=Penicillium hispanicum TaxID=1080232 RepID=UPI002541E7E6|nr:uncharacterized protein N7459_004486 [Penicillium hispanicum]KAJ5584686.1 hypothetical protein N7459_004486 [Penicillium hispanicum]
MAITWDSEADAKLAVGLATLSKVDWEALAKFMGNDCTPGALKHRISRLRARAGVTGSSPKANRVQKAKSPKKVKKPKKEQTPDDSNSDEHFSLDDNSTDNKEEPLATVKDEALADDEYEA